MSRIEILEQDIHALRQKMYAVFHQSGSYTDPELLRISQKLDEQLNAWQKLRVEKKR
ncbi:MAG: aspartyl-phosphate phosphatase Spo0E family protein [Candidatus Carbobacillus sp.]|nr:aspartyl-phosphate phosphatase Spo0E family protein [Candidatus Carbobacillus sp.]